MTRPRRRFGQNFLQDDSVIERIIDAIDPRVDQHLVEIGPGKGALTYPLLDSGCRLDAIELDRDLVQHWQAHAKKLKRDGTNLAQRAAVHNDQGESEQAQKEQIDTNHQKTNQAQPFTIHSNDALNIDFSQLVDKQPLRLVGNLPYNISTPLLFHFLKYRDALADIHVMLQKEVADRICADPGNKTYGRLTVMLAPYFDSEALFDVPPEAFFPAPKVTSTVLSININSNPAFAIADPSLYAAVVKQAFSQRRKTLRKSLKSLCDEACFSACEIDSSLRPEVLKPSEFAKLANYLANYSASAGTYNS